MTENEIPHKQTEERMWKCLYIDVIYSKKRRKHC